MNEHLQAAQQISAAEEIDLEVALEIKAGLQERVDTDTGVISVASGIDKIRGAIHVIFPPGGPCLVLRAAMDRVSRMLSPTIAMAALLSMAFFAHNLPGPSVTDTWLMSLVHHAWFNRA
jgi:hypothetical protein